MTRDSRWVYIHAHLSPKPCTCTCTHKKGYRYVPEEGRWDSTNVFPKWRARYPDPPDLVGVTRIYERCVRKID